MKLEKKMSGNDRLLAHTNWIGKYLSKCSMIVIFAEVEFPDATLSVKAIENRTEEEEMV